MMASGRGFKSLVHLIFRAKELCHRLCVVEVVVDDSLGTNRREH